MRIVLGNPAPAESHTKDAATQRGLDLGQATELASGHVRFDLPAVEGAETVVEPPDGASDSDIIDAVKRVWEYHSTASAPTSIECDDPFVKEALERHFASAERERAAAEAHAADNPASGDSTSIGAGDVASLTGVLQAPASTADSPQLTPADEVAAHAANVPPAPVSPASEGTRSDAN